MPVRSYQILGLELAPDVLDWGAVEEVKDVLFSQTEMFTSEHTLQVQNASAIQGSSSFGKYSPSNVQSPFYGRSLQLLPTTLSLDGVVLFSGLLRDIQLDHGAKTASIVSQNYFTAAAASNAVLTASGNPAYIVERLLALAGLSSYVNAASFVQAGAGSAAAGATISVTYAAGSTTSVLSAVQAVCNLCSLSCYVRGGQIILQAWHPYQGNNSGIKWSIPSSAVYSYGTLTYAYEALSNSVTMAYGSNGQYSITNQASVLQNGINTPTAFNAVTGSAIAVPNLASAEYFSRLFLQRASSLRRQGVLTVGPSLAQAHIGDRVLVNAPNWGEAPIPFEIIETHLKLKDLSSDLTIAELPTLAGDAL